MYDLNTCENGKEPAQGKRRVIDGKECVYMTDPWSYLYTHSCWCSLDGLREEGITPPDEPDKN